MNQGQIKSKILVARTVDFMVFGIVVAFGAWGIFYSGKPALMGGIALAGLFVVNRLGNYTMTKVTILRQDLLKLERESKKT